MRPLENKQGVGFQRRGGHRHSIVQANYQWKIITTDGSRAANLCRSTLALENRWWNVRVLSDGVGWGGGGGLGDPIVTHTQSSTHQMWSSTRTVKYVLSGHLCCVAWAHQKMVRLSNTSMCSNGASEVGWHIWLPCCPVINSNLRIPLMFNRAGPFDGKHML